MIKCKKCDLSLDNKVTFKCKNCNTYFCEDCAKNTKNICPNCYNDIDYYD